MVGPIADYGVPGVPLNNADEAAHRRQLATSLNELSSRVGVRGTFAKGEDIASAATLVIGSDGVYFNVTGTTNISAMTVDPFRLFFLQYAGVLTLTDGASLKLPGGANITTAAGEHSICFSTAPDTVVVMSHE